MLLPKAVPHKPPVDKKTSANQTLFSALLLVGLVTLWSPNKVLAKDYKVEVLVFENLTEHRAYEPHHYAPPQAMKSEAETWFIEPSMLIDVATSLKKSRDYRLEHYFSWGQESLPSSEAAIFEAQKGLFNGWIKVYAKTLLFVNLDIDYDGYRLSEKRRLKLNERHFFDHPKFGVLMQVSRLEPNEQELEDATPGN